MATSALFRKEASEALALTPRSDRSRRRGEVAAEVIGTLELRWVGIKTAEAAQASKNIKHNCRQQAKSTATLTLHPDRPGNGRIVNAGLGRELWTEINTLIAIDNIYVPSSVCASVQTPDGTDRLDMKSDEVCVDKLAQHLPRFSSRGMLGLLQTRLLSTVYPVVMAAITEIP